MKPLTEMRLLYLGLRPRDYLGVIVGIALVYPFVFGMMLIGQALGL